MKGLDQAKANNPGGIPVVVIKIIGQELSPLLANQFKC